MKKRTTPVRKRVVWTRDGKKQVQLTLFRRQIEDKANPDPEPFNGQPKKGKARKKFLLGTGRL